MTRKMLHVQYVKSCIGYPERQKATLRALGLKRLGDRVEMPANPAVRGMLSRVSHLVQVEVTWLPDELRALSDASSDKEP